MSAAGQVALPGYIKPSAAPTSGPTIRDAGPVATLPGGITTYQGGYTDASGQNHSFAGEGGANNPVYRQTVGALSASQSPQQHSPFDGDPAYAAQRAAEQLGLPSINNNLNNLIAQRIANYGDASLASMAGFGLDPQAAAFARQNYLSGNAELARIDKAHQQARQSIINRLAGHGLLDSGETGYQSGLESQDYGNNVYDAQQKALADILGYRNSAQSQRDSLHQNVIAALENAFQSYSANPAAYGVINQTPPPTTSVKAPAKPAVKKTTNTALSALAARSAGLNAKYGLG